MNIHRATSKDLDRLVPLFDRYRGFYGQPRNVRGCRAFLAARLRAKDSVVFIAESDSGQALGFAQLYPSYSSVAMKRLWILNDLYIDESARRKGVAEALITHCVRLARETKSRGLMLETGVENTAARSLYGKLGWIEERSFLTYRLEL